MKSSYDELKEINVNLRKEINELKEELRQTQKGNLEQELDKEGNEEWYKVLDFASTEGIYIL